MHDDLLAVADGDETDAVEIFGGGGAEVAGDGEGDVGVGRFVQDALYHGSGDGIRDGGVLVDELPININPTAFAVALINHEPASEDLRCAGNVRDQRCNLTSGAAFGKHDASIVPGQIFDHGGGEFSVGQRRGGSVSS